MKGLVPARALSGGAGASCLLSPSAKFLLFQPLARLAETS